MKQFEFVNQYRNKKKSNDYTETTKKELPDYKTKLLKLLTYKLKQFIRNQSNAKRFFTYTINNRRLWITIQSGLYSIHVLKTLQKEGMSVHTIIKAMKLGLVRLNRCELFYFKSFEVEPYTLQLQDTWTSKFSDELISNLRSTGLSESECWHIIIYGIDSQSPRILCRLLLNGIDVPGIINWQSPVTRASPKIIQFLEHIGIKEDVVQLVEQYGINEEIEQILSNIGYDETEETGLTTEEIICECNLTMLGQEIDSSEIINNICETSNSRSTSTSINTLDYFQQCNSQCHLGTEKNIMEELSVQRNNYLRQNIMVPVAWAMAKALKYEPSDPIHYMAYQLLRWKNNNVIQTKKDTIYEVIALATVTMDQKLILRMKEKLIKSLNEEAMENIPCTVCKDYQTLHRIQQKCWKCTKKLARKYETCKFQEICSSCKIDEID